MLGKRTLLLVCVLAATALLSAGCGPTAGKGCDLGEVLCNGDCVTGDSCGDDCAGGADTVCVGNEVHSCDNGSVGGVVDTCQFQCNAGSCVDANGCSDSAESYIYVVDDSWLLYRYDPAANSFDEIGELECPAGLPLSRRQTFATPFSMSIDRNGDAWVLYSSGQLFKVSTENATCSDTGFEPLQRDYDLFGMGFVANQSGSSNERLFVSGSQMDRSSGELYDTKLGFIEPGNLQVTHLSEMNIGDNPPELTGTGDARLYAYFPGDQSFVAEFDKTTGQPVGGKQWPAGEVDGDPAAWAFAQFGGYFYIFISTEGAFGGAFAEVIRLDPNANGGAGTAEMINDDDVPIIVGAGVSTCAPFVVE